MTRIANTYGRDPARVSEVHGKGALLPHSCVVGMEFPFGMTQSSGDGWWMVANFLLCILYQNKTNEKTQ